jgi:ketosteroid isomerase-like protein
MSVPVLKCTLTLFTMSSESAQLKIMDGYKQATEAKDLDSIAKHLHKDFQYVCLPRSLNTPPQNKEQWREQFAAYINLWTDIKITVHTTINTPGKVITHSTGAIKTKIGDTNHESISITYFATDADGSLKIIKIEDFTDSKEHYDTMQAMSGAFSPATGTGPSFA